MESVNPYSASSGKITLDMNVLISAIVWSVRRMKYAIKQLVKKYANPGRSMLMESVLMSARTIFAATTSFVRGKDVLHANIKAKMKLTVQLEFLKVLSITTAKKTVQP